MKILLAVLRNNDFVSLQINFNRNTHTINVSLRKNSLTNQELNLGPCVYYTHALPTELLSQTGKNLDFLVLGLQLQFLYPHNIFSSEQLIQRIWKSFQLYSQFVIQVNLNLQGNYNLPINFNRNTHTINVRYCKFIVFHCVI